jgi:hypothetical protein
MIMLFPDQLFRQWRLVADGDVRESLVAAAARQSSAVTPHCSTRTCDIAQPPLFRPFDTSLSLAIKRQEILHQIFTDYTPWISIFRTDGRAVKALASGASREICVGSIPTLFIIFFAVVFAVVKSFLGGGGGLGGETPRLLTLRFAFCNF